MTAELAVVAGGALTRDQRIACEVVVVGSGPAGAAAARILAEAGLAVVVLEEGPHIEPGSFPEDGFTAMAILYRGLGATLVHGPCPFPYVQGRVVGGGSVINGAISWRLPEDVLSAWHEVDAELAAAWPRDVIAGLGARIEAELGVTPTPAAVAGPHNLLMARGAEALGLAHRPIRRYTPGCTGLGRCLQGCPAGHKRSVDRAHLLWAQRHGARVYAETRVRRLLHRGRRVVGLVARTSGGARLEVRADRVIVAAGAVQSPVLLRRSGIRVRGLGDGFQTHPGASVAGRFAEEIRLWEGATQGHEVTGLRHEGVKFEVLGYDLAIAAGRVKGFGHTLATGIGDLAHWAHWGVALRAHARGRVRPLPGGGVRVAYRLTTEDLHRLRWGIARLGQVLLAAGAEYVAPGVRGWPERVQDPTELERLAAAGPDDPRAFTLAATHLFATARAGAPEQGVVSPWDGALHGWEGVHVVDASVFPSNTGVNPQTAIMTLATRLALGITEQDPAAWLARVGDPTPQSA